MESPRKQSVHESVQAALHGWKRQRALLGSDVLQALASEEIDLAPEEVDLVVESLIAEVNDELKWIIDWETIEQGGEYNDFPDIDLPTFSRYERCLRLLTWAGSHGVGERVTDVYRSIKERFPGRADGVIQWLISYRSAPGGPHHAGDPRAAAGDQEAGHRRAGIYHPHQD